VNECKPLVAGAAVEGAGAGGGGRGAGGGSRGGGGGGSGGGCGGGVGMMRWYNQSSSSDSGKVHCYSTAIVRAAAAAVEAKVTASAATA